MIEELITTVDRYDLRRIFQNGICKSGKYLVTDNHTFLAYYEIDQDKNITSQWIVDLYFGIDSTTRHIQVWGRLVEQIGIMIDNKFVLSSEEFFDYLKEKHPDHLNWIIFNQFWFTKILKESMTRGIKL